MGVELDMKHDKEADKNCRHFENKADYIKVVRCKDCERVNKYKDRYFCRNDNSEMNADDFCSYGERKQKNDFKE